MGGNGLIEYCDTSVVPDNPVVVGSRETFICHPGKLLVGQEPLIATHFQVNASVFVIYTQMKEAIDTVARAQQNCSNDSSDFAMSHAVLCVSQRDHRRYQNCILLQAKLDILEQAKRAHRLHPFLFLTSLLPL